MPDNIDKRIDLLKDNWKIVQDIIKTLGERGWKIRSWALTLWWAVIGYAVTTGKAYMILYLIAFILIVFMIDVPWKLMEERFLVRNIQIEKLLTEITIGDEEALLGYVVSTNIDPPEIKDIKTLLTIKRASFWVPYLLLTLLTIVIWLIASDKINI